MNNRKFVKGKKYGVATKGLNVVIEELKQFILAKKAKLTRCEQQINNTSKTNCLELTRKDFYQEINDTLACKKDQFLMQMKVDNFKVRCGESRKNTIVDLNGSEVWSDQLLIPGKKQSSSP